MCYYCRRISHLSSSCSSSSEEETTLIAIANLDVAQEDIVWTSHGKEWNIPHVSTVGSLDLERELDIEEIVSEIDTICESSSSSNGLEDLDERYVFEGKSYQILRNLRSLKPQFRS